ncbi:transcriptional regulator [Mycobacterium gordonae]|jgi:transcriptional regulator with XRE-family HTH domain|uniref:Transcriptional regulator n=1 Tax=Mycobacterium gordonae TaxID=1778 RepID=A0A1A6BBM6_MYCGO|nr:helix-turn-helix transcriptional regulator [Mycobacterium gordonae]OBR99771.1 transcriptional regulator [Mycobacterium gordonae]
MHDDADAVGVARAGAAFAARREELGLSQRQLATMKIIGAPNLIAFEKGRSWPRERTLAKLEQAVQWPPGTLARMRAGGAASVSGAIGTPQPDSDAAAVVTGAVTVAVGRVLAAADELPDEHDDTYPARVRAVLADLRTLESIAARAVRSSQGSPEVIAALREIRQRYTVLMARAAGAPGATVGQRIYTVRQAAALTVAEAAGAMGASPAVVVAAESEQPVEEADRRRIEAFIDQVGG